MNFAIDIIYYTRKSTTIRTKHNFNRVNNLIISYRGTYKNQMKYLTFMHYVSENSWCLYAYINKTSMLFVVGKNNLSYAFVEFILFVKYLSLSAYDTFLLR